TVSVYGGYRLRPTVNLSIHSSYGSGFPIPGYLTMINGAYYLASTRNQVRLGAYERTDFRVNKSWMHAKWKLTLYGELVNLTNKKNYIFESLNEFSAKTGKISVTLDQTFPILPSVGIATEW